MLGKTRILLACLAAAALLPAVRADEAAKDPALDRAKGVVKVRESLMYLVRWNVAPMAGMVKEVVPYDAAQFERNAQRLAQLAAMAEDAFGPDVRGFDVHTEAKPEIWDDFAEFSRLSQELVESTAELARVAVEGKFDTSKQAFMAVADDCKACHDKFRVDD
jgi:cytochrome c556